MSKTLKSKPDPATRIGTWLIITSPIIWIVGMATAAASGPLNSLWVATAGLVITSVGIFIFLHGYEIVDAIAEYVAVRRHRCNDDC